MTAMTLNAARPSTAHPNTRSAAQFTLLVLLGAAILIPAGIAGVHGVMAAVMLAATVAFVLRVPVTTELRTVLAVLGLATISLVSASSMLSVMSAPACAVYAPTVAAFFFGGSAALWTRFYLKK